MNEEKAKLNDYETRYCNFLWETLNADQLARFHDTFARMAFNYFEKESQIYFEKEFFVALIADFLEKGRFYKSNNTFLAPDIGKWLRSISEKNVILSHIRSNDPRADMFKKRLNFSKQEDSRIYFEMTSPKFSIAQKLDIFHFVLCALHYKSDRGSRLKQAISEVTYMRQKLVLEGLRNLADQDRAITAQVQDIETEKLWATEDFSNLISANHKDLELEGERGKKPVLNATRAGILMQYFIAEFRLGTIDRTNFARLLAALNDGKNEKKFYDNLNPSNKTLLFTNDGDDARQVAALCRELKLTTIAESIENDLRRKNKNL